MIFSYFKKTEDEDKNKNIVDAQAPFHQVSADKFNSLLMTFFKNPEKNKKPKSKRNPKYRLEKSFENGDGCASLTEQAKVKANCCDQYNGKNNIAELLRIHPIKLC